MRWGDPAAHICEEGSIRKSSPALVALLLGPAQVLTGQDLGSISGIVRDTAGAALSGAEIILGSKRQSTTLQGAFRFDSLATGTFLITIRLPGYAALRSPVTVRTGSQNIDYILRPATQVLPTVYVEARRTGIYGSVGDSSLKPLAGVRVQLAGRGGGQAITDSTGRFAFPSASGGEYVVRTHHPGYAEQRLFLELKKQEGVELAIRLSHSLQGTSRADLVAVQDLSRRLSANLPGDRLNARELERYGSLGLCDVTELSARVRASIGGLTIILNGTHVLENMSVSDLCSWRAAEVRLVEFGDTVCRDVTRTLVDMLNVWCTRFTKQRDGAPVDPRRALPVPPGGRMRTQRPGGPFVVIWERR